MKFPRHITVGGTIHRGVGPIYHDSEDGLHYTYMRWTACGLYWWEPYTKANDGESCVFTDPVDCRNCLRVKPKTIQKRLQWIHNQEVAREVMET